jgi:hypothetical protein
MGEKIRLKISAAAIRFARGEADREEKLQVVRGEFGLGVKDRSAVLLFLCQDEDPEVKSGAITALRGLPADAVLLTARDPDAHPKLLDIFARLHVADRSIAEAVAVNPHCGEPTHRFLAEHGMIPGVEPEPDEETETSDSEVVSGEAPEDELPPGEEECTEEGEEFQSKYQLAQNLGVAEKIKMALTGDKEWRNILIKDANKLVSGAVIKNPRITEAEVLAICKSTVQNDEIIRIICANKEWIKNYPIRKALVENHKTPLPNALRYMASLTEKDLGFLAKSKNISTVIATNARKLLLNKKRG